MNSTVKKKKVTKKSYRGGRLVSSKLITEAKIWTPSKQTGCYNVY